MNTQMLTHYVDVNTYEIKQAEYFSWDYVSDTTVLRDENGELFRVSRWQMDLNNGLKIKK